ncbi:MAG: hypothetical protein ABL986_17100 [Vicinamibacterales bacterium]
MSQDQQVRQKAKALGALDASDLIKTVPGMAGLLTRAQIDQIQDVLDAAVLNPVLKQEGDEIYRKSVTFQIGNQVNRDPDLVRKADAVYARMIPVSEQSRRIRLDVDRLLAADALLPRTDNPDEIAYLGKVKTTLLSKGIWLRISQPYVRDTQDRSRHVLDPRTFELWFSLGSDGDAIPTRDGTIDREELLATTMIGAGYYRAVTSGHVQMTLRREMIRLEVEIEDGIAEHNRLIARKRDAFPGVAEIADALGGADLPSRSIWDHSHKMLVTALTLNISGSVSASQVYLTVAAVSARNAAMMVADYADKSAQGAASAIGIAKVVKTVAAIAEVALTVTGVGIAAKLARGGATAARSSSLDLAAEKLVEQYAKKNGISTAELSITKYVPQPKGSVAGGVKPGTSSGAGTGWHQW